MSKLIPIIAGVTGTAVIASAGGYLLSTQNTKTFKEKFKHSLILLDGKGDDLFKEKLKKLKDGNVNSDNTKLKEAKSKISDGTDAGLAELKQACQEIYNSNFTNKESKIFKDFQSYCSKNIKDQITATKWALTESNFQWKPKNEALKSSKKNLVDALAKIVAKTAIGDNDLKEWCQGVENLVFEGTENDVYQNANEFCTK